MKFFTHIVGLSFVFILAMSISATAATPAKEKQSDLEKMQGAWRVVSSQVADEKADEEEVKRRKVTFKEDQIIYEYGNPQKEKREGTVKLDSKTHAFDWVTHDATMQAIYELKGDDLKIGFGNDGLVRPKRFTIDKENVVWLLVLKRDPQK